MHNYLFCDNNFLVLTIDTAKLESTLEDMTVYAALGSIANLTVKFHINPLKSYNIYWSMKDTDIQDAGISSTEKKEYIQTTYSISEVTKLHLGNYTVQVINQAIIGELNEARFTVVLKLTGENNNPCKFRLLQHILHISSVWEYDRIKPFTYKNRIYT